MIQPLPHAAQVATHSGEPGPGQVRGGGDDAVRADAGRPQPRSINMAPSINVSDIDHRPDPRRALIPFGPGMSAGSRIVTVVLKSRGWNKFTKSPAKHGSATLPPHGGGGGGGRYATGRVVSTSDLIGSPLSGENVKPDPMVELVFLSRAAQVRDLVLDL